MSLNSQSVILRSIASSLSCPVYWEKQHQDWTIIDYYKKLIEINPTITKRTAAGLLKRDLTELNVAFISNKNVKKKIEAISLESKKSTDIITEFWREHSDTLKKLALQNSVDENIVERVLKRKATNGIVESFSSRTVTTTTQPELILKKRLRNRKRKQKESETTATHDAELIESDNVFVAGCDISVGTMIKRAAYNLHEKNQPMSCRERKIMTSGLSSILDLSDDSFDSQRSLFTQTQWDELHARYDPKFDTPLYELDSDVVDFLKIACGTLELSNDIDCTLKFLRKSQEQLTSVSSIALKIAEHILGLTKSYNYLLSQNPTKDVTELDCYCTIWSPIFLLLFPPSNHVRVKAGESINSSSTINKKELYRENSHVKAFKIDFRFLADMGNEEYDIGVGECAVNSSDTKAVKDEGKLTREAKDAVDKILRAVSEKVNTKVWTIQTLGSSCSISMLDIFDVGLYVANYKYTFSIPNTTNSFIENINMILKYLLTMQRDITKLANSIVSSQEPESNSHDNSFNRERRTHELNPRLHYTRDTYYTPPRASASKLPHHYYGPPPPSILNKLQHLSGKDYVARPIEDDNQSYDVYGYRLVGDGTYYNKFTKKITEVHPTLQ
ncbi:hypothetical protein PS15p_209370 [Mucor circinelloides]